MRSVSTQANQSQNYYNLYIFSLTSVTWGSENVICAGDEFGFLWFYEMRSYLESSENKLEVSRSKIRRIKGYPSAHTVATADDDQVIGLYTATTAEKM